MKKPKGIPKCIRCGSGEGIALILWGRGTDDFDVWVCFLCGYKFWWNKDHWEGRAR